VDVAVQRGLGAVTAKSELLRRWGQAALDSGEHGEAACLVLAACELGGTRFALPAEVAASVADIIRAFLADAGRSQPLGFYTRTEELASIFRQDRLLMTLLSDDPAADRAAALLRNDTTLLQAYQTILAFAARLTNPPAVGAHDLLAAGKKGRRILVPSRSHEAALVLRLFGDRPIPSGFDLAEELATRVADGSLSLAPGEDSGWYDHQTWALETLVAPARAREGARMRVSADYRRHLREVFKGLLALTRETHVKQLEPVAAGCAPSRGGEKLTIRPELSAEPLATFYLRRAHSYRFVRGVLEELFGPGFGALTFTEVRSAWDRVDEGLAGMEGLFYGAHVRVCRELGLEHETMPGRNGEADDTHFRDWASSSARDPDLAKDTRMMVPVFYDVERQAMKVWAMLGWSERPLTVDFHQPPQVLDVERTARPRGKLEELRRRFRKKPDETFPEIVFAPAYHRVAFPVTAELYVNRLHDREDFRRLCDQHKTRTAILQALG
jgi:hypothetical protein